MNYHNPENLSDWGQADGWRLLTTEEIKQPLPDDAEYWSGKWGPSNWRGKMMSVFDQENTVYRTRQPLPVSPLIAQLDAEIKAKQELKEIALAVEAGAEWEVNWPGVGKWESPVHSFKYYIDHKAPVRLKPKPVTRPWRLKDVPWNFRIRGKQTKDKDFWFTPFAADHAGVYINNMGPARLVQWDELQVAWEHTTPELKGEWKPCTTEEAK